MSEDSNPRSVTISLPSSNPDSQLIWQYLAMQPRERDRSAPLRAALALGLRMQGLVAPLESRLTRIEDKLTALLEGHFVRAGQPETKQVVDAAIADILDTLIDFNLPAED